MPLISIIVPNYNHANFLTQRLESILNQTYQNFEIILLDDCSLDNSQDIIELYRSNPKISHIIYNQKNSGSTFKQWQKGINLAKGDFIWIAESDDVSDKRFLEKSTSFLNNGFDLVYCRSQKIDEKGNVLNEGYFWPDGLDPQKWKRDFDANGNDEIRDSFLYRNVLPNASSCVFKKSIISNFNLITNFKYAGDWLFWVYIIQNKKIKYLAQPLNLFRTHYNSSRANKSKTEEEIRIKEYFSVISHITRILKLNSCSVTKINYDNYNWIFEDIYAKRTIFGFKYFFPAIPFRFLFHYYRFILKRKY